VKSYTIYRKEVLAVADAKVASTIEGMPNETPGTMPENIAIEEADGNSVILDLGGGRYALYAHLDPGSVRVHKGDTVKRGQVIGRRQHGKFACAAPALSCDEPCDAAGVERAALRD
jgi:murein DD-endopeptidase MepM/ murein hydrolase activator NlpD